MRIFLLYLDRIARIKGTVTPIHYTECKYQKMSFVVNTILLLAVIAFAVHAEPFVLSGLCTDPTEPVMFKVHVTADNSSNQYDAEWFIALNQVLYPGASVFCGDSWQVGYGTLGSLYIESPVVVLGQFDNAGVYYDVGTMTTYEIVEMYFLGNPSGTSSDTSARAAPNAFFLPLYRMLC